MTPNILLAAGFLVLAAVVTWHLVAALRQVKSTALAAERMMAGARPDIEAAAGHLRSVLSRTDRFLAAAEESGIEARSLLHLITQAISGWRREPKESTSRFVQMVSFFSNAVLWISRLWPQGPEERMSAGGRPAEGGAKT
jgi:ABC-type transporter Mla subunit MlaD